MLDHYQKYTLPFMEFISMMALMMSLVALSIDAVLPAMESIGVSLGVSNANDNQHLINSLFLGLAIGQLLFGPLSDSIGRRRAMMMGYSVFFVGIILALVANDMNTLLISRVLQGFGLAAPRVVSLAIIRDLYKGRAMARVMSFITMIFILVPMLAPMFGQAILTIADWQSIFIATALIGLVSLGWYLLRQKETLAAEDRADFTIKRSAHALKAIVSSRAAIGFTIAAGFTAGPFIFYLSSAQQLFQNTYQLGQWFPLYFAGLALGIGLGSFINGKRVMKSGMHHMVEVSLTLMTTASLMFVIISWWFNGLPDLWITTIYMLFTFFCMGLLFGNLNALAMEPLGHIAGIGAAMVGFLSTLLAAILAIIIGLQFNGTIYALVLSFLIAGLANLVLMKWIGNEKATEIKIET